MLGVERFATVCSNTHIDNAARTGANEMTEAQARSKFAAYFLDLKADAVSAGATVSKQSEWQLFILVEMEEGRIPAEAIRWKCPRTLKI